MHLLKSICVLLTFGVLAAGTATMQAAEQAVVCEAASAKEARAFAEEARRNSEHRRAAACYRLAGEPVEADRALAQAFGEASAAAGKKAAATLDDARAQARRVHEAFRGRPASRRS